MTRQRENDFLSHQIVEFNSFAVKRRQVQVVFTQLVLLFMLPRDSRCKSLGELDVDRQLNRFQTAAAGNSYLIIAGHAALSKRTSEGGQYRER